MAHTAEPACQICPPATRPSHPSPAKLCATNPDIDPSPVVLHGDFVCAVPRAAACISAAAGTSKVSPWNLNATVSRWKICLGWGFFHTHTMISFRLTWGETGKHRFITDQIAALLNPVPDDSRHFPVVFRRRWQTAALLVVRQLCMIHQGDGSKVPPSVTGQIPPTRPTPLGRHKFTSPSELHDFVRPSQTRNHG